VHAAILKNSRKEVVLKVLKPGVEDVLETDLAFVYLASRLLEFVQPELERLSLSGVLQDIRTSMIAGQCFHLEYSLYIPCVLFA
jgi:aarF domain-containing kinase